MANFIVTTLSDSGDNTTTAGSLAADQADGGGLSLREAVSLANASGTVDTITFDAALAGGTIAFSAGHLEITSSMTIDGDIDGNGSADITLDAQDASRVFNIDATDTPTTLSGLVMTGGQTVGSGNFVSGYQTAGGAIRSFSDLTIRDSVLHDNTTNGGNASGGAISVFADLTLINSTVDNNHTLGGGSSGGGIRVRNGELTIYSSTISNNSTSGVTSRGGGIQSLGAAGETIITNSTIAGNQTLSSSGLGAGIHIQEQSAHIINSTITDNATLGFSSAGGGLYTRGSGNAEELNLINSIISGNHTAQAGYDEYRARSVTVIKDGGNILGTDIFNDAADVGNITAASIFAATVNNNGVDAGALANNGGQVQTVALLSTGDAVDAGDSALLVEATQGLDLNGDGDQLDTITTDANGGVRVGGLSVDIGAVEIQPPETASLIVTTISDVVDNFDGETSLREAIGHVNAGTLSGTITFANGVGEAFENAATIALSGGQLSLNSAVTIDGDLDDDGVADVTVDAQGNSRVFQVSTTGVVIDGLVVTGGAVSGGNDGAGILVESGGGLALSNASVQGNTASGGGSFGGGVFALSSDLSITNSQITGNSATDGGGIQHGGGTLLIEDSTISNNTATGSGGGIRASNYLTVLNSTISGNISNGKGGGIFASTASGFSVTNSTVHGNTATEGAGIYLNSQPDADFTNTTISGNHATSQVGGVFVGNKGGYAAFSNVVFIGNTDSDGVLSELGGQTAPTFFGLNLVGESASQFDASVSANVSNATAASVFAATVTQNGADAGVLADNGGPVETIALLEDVTNAAVNSGDASFLDEATAGRDLNGDGDQADTIVIDANGGARVIGPAVDLGAFESQVAPETASLIVTTASDVVDQFDGVTSLREAISFANSDADASTITFAAGVGEAFENGALIRLTAGQLAITQETTIDGAGNVTITGDANDNDVTVDGDITDVAASGSALLTDNSRIFSIASNAQTDLNGLTLTGGRTNANYQSGGAILTQSDLVLNNSTLIGNSTRGSYASGGGISSRGSVTLNDSTISNNSTAGYQSLGGGISTNRGVILTNTTVSGNSTTGFDASGGGIQSGQYAAIINSTFSGNSTLGDVSLGGGLASNGTIVLTNATFSGNSTAGSVAHGGAIKHTGSALVAVNSTFSGNSTTGTNAEGGAIHLNSDVTLVNSILSGNIAVSGSAAGNDIYQFDHPFVTYSSTYIGGNIVGADVFSGATDIGDTSAASIFAAVANNNGVDAGVLAVNGGLVQTIALLADPANAAIDSGDATQLAEATIGIDLDGDGDQLDTISLDANGDARVSGTDVDLGAVEAQETFGSTGDDVLVGNATDENIATGSGGDAVNAGAGNDTVNAGAGDDLVLGGEGQDLIYGGDDDDQILPGADADTVFGGDGVDTVSYVLSDPGVTVDLSDNANNSGDAAGDVIVEVENIIGSAVASNTLTGDAANNTIEGGAADDTLNGGGGNDRLEGNGGADTFDGGLGDDVIVVDSADDVTDQQAGEGYDRVFASSSVTLGDHVEAGNLTGSDDLSMTAAATGSWIQGNAGNNMLLGQGGNDRLDGNAGDDTIDGGAGNDVHEGGSGADVFVLSTGLDVILDFEDGIDLIDLTAQGVRFEDVTLVESGPNVVLSHGTGSLTINNLTAAELSDADFIQPLASTPPVVIGTVGNDNLTQNSGPLDIRGLDGNDLLRAFSGAVTLTGGDGDDRYYAFDERTTIVELANEGFDRVYTRVDITLSDNVEFGATNGVGDIDITGNALDNQITGNGDSNILIGLDGNDRIIGKAGSDTLDGGLGNDILEGGADADIFVFDIGYQTDVIQDFQVGTDTVDFSATNLSFDDLAILDAANNVDALVLYGSDVILLKNNSASQLDASSFVFNNAAPVIAGDTALAPVNEDSTGDAGQTLAALFATQATDADGTISAFALAEINTDPVTEGIWEVSLDGGTDFIPLDDPNFITLDNALVVPASIIVRFIPAADFSGTPGALTVFALDDTYSGGLSPADGFIFIDTATGGDPSFLSANGGDVTIIVNPVNDAPEVAGPVALTEVDEGSTNHAGNEVSQLFTTDASDVDGTVTGFAVTANAATPAEGEWQISFDAGASFVDLDTVVAAPSDANALVIDPNAVLRFLAPTNFAPAGATATPGGLTVRALDDTYTGGFSITGLAVVIDASINGGDTAISQTTALVDAPIASIINPPEFLGTSVTTAALNDLDPTDVPDPSLGQQVSGTLLFSDQDVGATHSIAVTGVTIGGETGTINDIPDALALFSFATLDQVADSVVWTFDQELDAILDLGLGEAVTFDYNVELTDNTGQTDTETVSITVNSAPFVTDSFTSTTTLNGASGPLSQSVFVEPSAADGTADVRIVLNLQGITSLNTITLEARDLLTNPSTGGAAAQSFQLDTFDFADLTLRSDGLHELEIDDLGTFAHGTPPSGFVLTDPDVIGLTVRTSFDDPVTAAPFVEFLVTNVELEFV